jgi:carboxypeptidase family protein
MVRRSVTWIAMAVLIAPAGYAQTVAIAQISGIVSDESGGALPGVEVQVTQTATGATRFAITGERGEYVLANLPIGPYKLEAKLQGFNAYERSGITLTVGANAVINVVLQVGAVAETVTVVANSPLVETRNTGVGTTVTEEQMVGLPLNGRQASQLIYLSGPAVDNGGSGALIGSQRQYPSAVAISVAGGTGNSTLYLVDGGYNNDPLNNIGQPMPFPDALQEFKLENGVRPARYGVYTGATVNAVTKSGSNTFHGDAFAFGRHHAFNARGHFDIADDGLVRVQSGGTLGGPIIRNKLFFFAGPQITNERVRPTSSDTFIPTAKMLAGDFTDVMSAQCQNGVNRTLGAPFVNNTVNPAVFNPIALKIAALLPTATTDPCGRTRFTVPNDSDELQTVVRSDYQLNASQKVFGRYYIANYDRRPSYDGTNVLMATGSGLGLDNRVQTLALGHDWVVTSNLIAATRFSFQRSRILRVQGTALPTWTELGANVYSYTHEPGQNFYNLNVTNGWATPAFPGKFISTTPQFSEDIDWVRGAHSLSFGGMWIRPFEDADGPFQANGTFAFNGTRAGGATAQDRLGMADFLLGLPSSFSQGGSQIVAEKMHYVGVYAQDVWRVNTRLTLSGGLRWEPYLAAKDQNGFTTAFNMDWFNQNRHSVVYANAPAGLMFAGDEGFPDNGANTANRYAQFAPRGGVVWDLSGEGTETVRAAAGLYYDSPKLWQYGHHMLNPPFGNTVAVTNPSLANPWANFPGGNPLPVPSPIPPAITFPLLGTYVSMPVDVHPMQVKQWNVSYEKQVLGDILLSATYLGNQTAHLWNSYELNPGVYIAGQSTTANVDARRVLNLLNPAPGKYYGSVSVTDDNGSGHYHGLVLAVQKRLSHGWSANTNFTVAKCLNDGEPSTDIGNTYPDPNDRNTNWGPCDSDRHYISNTSLIVQSRGFGSGLAHALTDSWQFGTVFQARTGAPLTPGTTGNLSLTGLNNQRPIIVGDPSASDPNENLWFSIAAFAPNTPGVWGNTPKGFLRGPGFWNVDLALSRNIGVGGSRRVEVRIESFNVFNNVNLGNPNVTFGNANFARITTTAGGPRIMQFAAKYVF